MWNTHSVTVLPHNHEATGLHGYRVKFSDCEPRNRETKGQYQSETLTELLCNHEATGLSGYVVTESYFVTM